MDYYKNNSRTEELEDYKKYLNKMVVDSSFKEKLSEDDKLAKVLLFNLEFYQTYNQHEHLVKTMMILDYYADVVQDRNDIFQRMMIDLSRVPKKVRKYLFKEYKVYNKTLDKVLKENKVFVEQKAQEENNTVVIDGERYEVVEVLEENKSDDLTAIKNSLQENDDEEEIDVFLPTD